MRAQTKVKKNKLRNPVVLLSTLIVILLGGCDSVRRQAEIEQLRAEAQSARAEAESIRQKNQSKKLVHCVWFKLSKDIDGAGINELIDEILKLKNIEQVSGLEIGRFHDLADPRAMSDYQLYMQMRFASDEDYETYQEHPIHLQLKQEVKKFLGGPPLTYDYLVHQVGE